MQFLHLQQTRHFQSQSLFAKIVKRLRVLFKKRRILFKRFQFWANCKLVELLPPWMDRPWFRRCQFWQRILLIDLVSVKCILVLYTNFSITSCTSWIVASFRKTSAPKSAKHNQQTDKQLGEKDNQRSGTGLSQTRQRFFSFLVLVKDIFAQINKILWINHLSAALN